jgi:hypothetical protein
MKHLFISALAVLGIAWNVDLTVAACNHPAETREKV